MDQKIKSFLDLIAYSEGTSTHPLTQNDGYDVVVSGVDGIEVFTDNHEHPFTHRPPKVIKRSPRLMSTAAGRYQILYHYWVGYKKMLKLPDFSPASQDAVAIRLIHERGAHLDIDAGEIQHAITLCSNIWASLPGNMYGQGGKSMEALMSKYNSLREA